jgi:hypothetical protein
MTIQPSDSNSPQTNAWFNSVDTEVIELNYDEPTSHPSEEEIRAYREHLRKRYGPKTPPSEPPPPHTPGS